MDSYFDNKQLTQQLVLFSKKNLQSAEIHKTESHAQTSYHILQAYGSLKTSACVAITSLFNVISSDPKFPI
uniref:Uncharacterized protein n=1 Tax=Arundo donax TaxID=35708 RepID=A0A0A8Z8E9_ARUDO